MQRYYLCMTADPCSTDERYIVSVSDSGRGVVLKTILAESYIDACQKFSFKIHFRGHSHFLALHEDGVFYSG